MASPLIRAIVAALMLHLSVSGLPTTGAVKSADADLPALVSIKDHFDPSSSSFPSWNSSSLHFCKWPGVTCRSDERVISLDLHGLCLSGSLSPDIGNLTFLKSLNLSLNNLQGHIPPELGRLSHLESLLLRQNALQGRIPAALANCSNLRHVSLGSNNLSGEIPTELGSLRNLVILSLHDNSLTGRIPDTLGNLSSLTHIDLGGNQMEGSIPCTLGSLHRLKHLSLTGNRLTGAIPPSIFRISTLSHLYLGNNQLSGSLPPDMGNTLVSLQILQAYSNNIEGPIPNSLANTSMLREIVLAYNNLSGTLPRDLGRLRNLSSLNLRNNSLQAKKAEDWEFLTSLANCSNLQILDLSYNMLEGTLPSTIANLSTQLTWLGLEGNKIHGSIPAKGGRWDNQSTSEQATCFVNATSLEDVPTSSSPGNDECADCGDGRVN